MTGLGRTVRALRTRFFRGDEGAEMVEFALVVLPLFGFIFVILAVGWVVFAKASLQYAVREGVRYAVTGHSASDIQAVVQRSAFGFLNGNQTYLNQNVPVTCPASTADVSNKVVQVSVTGVVVDPFGLSSFGLAPTTVSASSSDVMEVSGPPCV